MGRAGFANRAFDGESQIEKAELGLSGNLVGW
jgi:hypothetical protein